MPATEPGAAVRLPPGPRLPRPVQGAAFLASRRRTIRLMRRRYGREFTINTPLFGRVVFISDPALVKQLFMTSTDVAGKVKPNLRRLLGPDPFFNLDGDAHNRHRKPLA